MPKLAEAQDPSLVYEDPGSSRNLLACDQWATPGVRPLHDAWVHAQLTTLWPVHTLADRPRRYVFPIGCFHRPAQWAQDPLSYLPEAVLRDAQRGRVLLIFDQSQEGNADPDLWSWFYATASRWAVAAKNIIYMTSDHLAEKSHISWCDFNGVEPQMQVLSTLFNLHAITDMLGRRGTVPLSYDQWLQAKHSDTKLYNCLNRVLHPHRRWLFLKLFEQGLVPQGLISMDSFTDVPALPDGTLLDDSLVRRVQGLLPMVVDKADFTENHFNDLNPDIYLRSWVTVVTETYVDDAQLLIGEKVFKPMLCSSPFMILGNPGTLARLRELGFETFGMLWDESYDQLHTTARINAIVAQLQQLSRIPDLAQHFRRAESALRHNHALAWQLWTGSRDYQRLLAIWQRFVA